MKRIVALGLILCIILFGATYAEENSTCINMTEFIPNIVPDLIISAYTIDPSVAAKILMKMPYLYEDTENYYMGTAWLNDNEELAIGPDYLSYTTYQGQHLGNVVNSSVPGFWEWNNGNTSKLSLGNISQIAASAKDILKSLNIQADLVHVQSYSETTLYEKVQTAFREVDVNALEECYVLFFSCIENDIKMSTDGYYSDLHSVGTNGTKIVIIWTKDGLQSLSASGLYHIDEAQENIKTLIPPDTALNIVQNYYVLYDINFAYQRLEYVRVPIQGNDLYNSYALVPAWVFSQDQQFEIPGDNGTEEIEHVISDFTLIDARTGEEL